MMGPNKLDISHAKLLEEELCCSFIDYLFTEKFTEEYIDEPIDWDDLYFEVRSGDTLVCEIGSYDEHTCVIFPLQNLYYQHPDIEKDIIIDQFINISEEF